MHYNVAIVGAGMAGASLAAELAPHASVLLLEAEDQPGYHSTGRSAAFWSETYGGPLVQPLTTASYDFLANPSADFCGHSLLGPRGALHVAQDEGMHALVALAGEFSGTAVSLEKVDRAGLSAALPGLKAGWDHGIAEPSCKDIDVAALHGAYLRQARRSGARLVTSGQLRSAARVGSAWRVETAAGSFQADILVNAAGAWADDVAALCGAMPIGIRPFRRTVAQVRVSPPADPGLPLVMDALGRFYFKPESGRLWLSPHDETPCEAGDCAPDEVDVATAIHWLEQLVDWRVERVERSWAGLRSFAPDRLPVYGFATDVSGFFWFAGQGGFGIQTAPAAAKIAAALLLGNAADPMVVGIDPAPYAPGRFMN